MIRIGIGMGKTILIAIFLTVFLGQTLGQEEGEVSDTRHRIRGPSIMDVPEVIDPFGKPILFFSDGQGNIVVRRCESKTISPEENSCRPLPGSSDFKVSQEEFVRTLELLLLVETGDYTPEMQQDLLAYRENDSKGIRTAMEEFFKHKQGFGSKRMTALAGIPKFISELGENISIWERPCIGSSSHSHLGPPPDSEFVRQQIRNVNKKVEYLVKGIESAGLLMFYSEAEKNENFSFNILSSFLNFFEEAQALVQKSS